MIGSNPLLIARQENCTMGFFDAKWKNENIVEHKFSDIRISDFRSDSSILRFKYMLMFMKVLQGVAVFVADLFIMFLYFKLLITESSTISTGDQTVSWAVSLKIVTYRPYLYIISVIFSSLLSVYEWKIAQSVIKSGDIAAAFTSEMASTYYSIRSYSHFCFFQVVSNSTKLRDNLAFFVFFSFKNWKFTAAETPRRILNLVSIFALYEVSKRDIPTMFSGIKNNVTSNINYENLSVYGSFFTVTIWILSIFRFLAAIIIYIPLVTTFIQGSVRAYATHKIDKRITQILNRKKKRKLALEQKKLLLGNGQKRRSADINATLPDVGPVEEHIIGYDPLKSPHPEQGRQNYNFPSPYQDYPAVPNIPYNSTATMVSSQVSDNRTVNTMISSHVSDFNLPPKPQKARRPRDPNKPRRNRPKRSDDSIQSSDRTASPTRRKPRRSGDSHSSGSTNTSGSTAVNPHEPYRMQRK